MSIKTNYIHIKKDENGNEIARFPVNIKEEHIRIDDYSIEAGDLTAAISDKYRLNLWQAIEDGVKFQKPILYFIVMVKKDALVKQKMHIKLTISDKPLPNKMYESTDYWQYDYKKEELKLKWSIPHKSKFAMYLKDESKYDPLLIEWIKRFVKQEGMDVKKLESKKIKVIL